MSTRPSARLSAAQPCVAPSLCSALGSQSPEPKAESSFTPLDPSPCHRSCDRKTFALGDMGSDRPAASPALPSLLASFAMSPSPDTSKSKKFKTPMSSSRCSRNSRREMFSETDQSSDCENGHGMTNVKYNFSSRVGNPNCPMTSEQQQTKRRLTFDIEEEQSESKCLGELAQDPGQHHGATDADAAFDFGRFFDAGGARVYMEHFVENLADYYLFKADAQDGLLNVAKLPSSGGSLPKSNARILSVVSLCSGSGAGELTWRHAVDTIAEAFALPLTPKILFSAEMVKWKQTFLKENFLEAYVVG